MATEKMGTSPSMSRLGVDVLPSTLHEVKLQVKGKARMGISFWPTFSFTPSERETQYGTVHVMTTAEQEATRAALAAAGDSTGRHVSSAGASPGMSQGDGTAGAEAQQQALHEDHDAAAAQQSSSGELLSVVFTGNGKPLREFKVGASFLWGIPFPFISITTTKLEGIVDPATGKVELMFQAKFLSQVGSWIGATLTVDTLLTTEAGEACGVRRQGKRLQDGWCTLIAAAKIPSTGNRLADLILWLPAAAVAELPTHLTFK